MIIGICGFIGSGKDTAADYLVNFHEFKRESFAASLKDAVAAVFGWDREMLEGRTKSSREWREQVDTWWANRLGMPQLTPRWVLQYWGTDVLRGHFHDDIWIASVEHKVQQSLDSIVITDCRFPNEIAGLKSQGAKIVWVQRGPLPDWYNLAIQENVHKSEAAKWELIKRKIHASETSWVGTEFDAVINNNGTIDQLYSQLKSLVQ